MPYTVRKMTYNRGYGNVVVLTESANNKVTTKSVPYNRLQPLTGPFGDHSPTTADADFRVLTQQSNLAWTVVEPRAEN